MQSAWKMVLWVVEDGAILVTQRASVEQTRVESTSALQGAFPLRVVVGQSFPQRQLEGVLATTKSRALGEFLT